MADAMTPTRKQMTDAQRDAELEAEIARMEQERAAEEGEAQAQVDFENEEVVPNEVPDSMEPASNNAPEHDYEKRWKDTKSWASKEINKYKAELAAKEQFIEDLNGRLNEAQNTNTIPTDPEAYEEWKKEFPDSALMVDTAIEQRMKALTERLAKAEAALANSNKETSAQKAQRKLVEKHSDWPTIRSSPEYAEWVEGLTDRHRSNLFADDATAEDLIGYVAMFKAETGWKGKKSVPTPKGDTPRGTNNAPSTNSGGKGKIRESDIANMTSREYEKREAEIEKARASGNIIYDLTPLS